MSLGPAAVYDAPAPQPPLFTLVGAAQSVDNADDRWINGYKLRTYPCGPAHGYDACGGSGGVAKIAGDGPGLTGHVDPVVIYLPVTCQVRYEQAWSDLRAIALGAFNAYEYAAYEREFELGEINAANPRLAAPSTVTLNGGAAAPIRKAVGLLEGTIAASGARGMIHLPATFASDLVQSGGARQEGSRLVTPLGSIVVPGYGYTGASPAGAAPAANQAWAYATGLVQLRREAIARVIPDDASQAIDRQTNTLKLTVERVYSAAWDGCLHSAVLIDRG